MSMISPSPEEVLEQMRMERTHSATNSSGSIGGISTTSTGTTWPDFGATNNIVDYCPEEGTMEFIAYLIERDFHHQAPELFDEALKKAVAKRTAERISRKKTG